MIYSRDSTVVRLGFSLLALLPTVASSAPTVKNLTEADSLPFWKRTNFAFAFDIDGVLLRDDEPLPGATDTLLFLQNQSIPFMLMTNGGGKTEDARVMHLTEKLNVPLSTENFMQSHTPYKEMVKGTFVDIGPLENKTVLVTGVYQDVIRSIAEGYGFKNVVTPADIFTSEPLLWPFHTQATRDYYKTIAQPLPGNVSAADFKVDAIMTFNDLTDWAGELQLIVDLLTSEGGVLGTKSPQNGNSSLPNNGWQQDNQPDLIFSNMDFEFPTKYPHPRFAKGAIRKALEGIWAEKTDGADLKVTTMGKPHQWAYQYAENILKTYRDELLGVNALELRNVYMIGDTPLSDIKGANDFKSPAGTKWESILVETGNYQAGTTPKIIPTKLVHGVKDGVKWVLERHGYAQATLLN